MVGTLTISGHECKKISVALALALILTSSSVHAVDSPVNRMQTLRAQTETVRGLQLMSQNQWRLARDVIANARDPLAAKIYYWMLFTERGEFQNYTRLVQFIRTNPEWPEINSLIRKAEKDMPDDLPPREVLAWFKDYEPATAAGVDRYITALVDSGQQKKAQNFLADWWATTSLSRDDQKWIFRKYSAFFTMDAHRRRFDSMLLRGADKNATALAGVLGAGYTELAEARIALRKERKNVNGLINQVPQNLQNDPGLLFERLRWRRKNKLNDGAIQILSQAPGLKHVHNKKDWWRERHIIIRRLLEEKKFEQAYMLAKNHIQEPGSFQYAQAQWVSGWLALRFIKKPTEAYQHFEALHANVKTPISKSRGAYWAGRAAEDFGDTNISLQWFKNASQYSTTFYGQMAGAHLGLAGTLPGARPPTLTEADKQQFARTELVQASRLFAQAGLRKEGTAFLNAFVKDQGSAKAYRYAAELALEEGRTHDAVRISKNATKQGLFLTAQSYPVLTNYLQRVQTEWALVHAIIRQESVFDVQARSPVGARGLMQLMPATAKEVAGKLGIPHSTSLLTTNPSHNITLGSAYLSRMIERYDGAYPMAIAAYNAGPGRVDRWIKQFGDPRKGEIDWVDWIELIPIYETRNYVQRVMEGVYVYRLRLRKVQKPTTAPIHIAWKP